MKQRDNVVGRVVISMALMACSTPAPVHAPEVTKAAETLDDVVAPMVVWEEARPAMTAILSGARTSVLLPGEPALQCKVTTTDPPRETTRDLQLDCGAMTMTGLSSREIVRSINEGEVHRRVGLAIAANADLLRVALDVEVSLEEPPLDAPERIRFSLADPLNKVTLEVLPRGALLANVESPIGKQKLEATSFHSLGQMLFEHHGRVAVEMAQRQAAGAMADAASPLLKNLKIASTGWSYGDVLLDMTKLQLSQKTRFDSAPSPGVVGQEYPARYVRVTPRNWQDVQEANLLDGRVVRVVSHELPGPHVVAALIPHACEIERKLIETSLHLAPSDLTMKADTKSCVIELRQGDRGVTFHLATDRYAMFLELHSQDAAFAALTKEATEHQDERLRKANCAVCRERQPGTLLGANHRVVSVDRQACTMKVEVFMSQNRRREMAVPVQEFPCTVKWPTPAPQFE